MCGFDSCLLRKKSVIPIDPRTKIFLTVTVSTIMIAGGTGGMMNVIRPCLMALPMCLFLLSKRWKTVLKFSITYLVLFSMEITLLPLLTGMWNFCLGLPLESIHICCRDLSWVIILLIQQLSVNLWLRWKEYIFRKKL